MSIDKAKLKMQMANDFGATIEDRLEGERKTQYELQGAAAALKQAAQKVPRDLIAKLDREQSEGTSIIKDGLEAHHVVGLIKLWLTKASDYLGHLADVEQQKAIIQGGRAAGLEDAMRIIKRTRDESAQHIEDALAGSRLPGPLTESRSEASLARAEHGTVAERRAAAATAEGEQAEIPAPTPPPTEPAVEEARPVAKSRRKRKKS